MRLASKGCLVFVSALHHAPVQTVAATPSVIAGRVGHVACQSEGSPRPRIVSLGIGQFLGAGKGPATTSTYRYYLRPTLRLENQREPIYVLLYFALSGISSVQLQHPVLLAMFLELLLCDAPIDCFPGMFSFGFVNT